MERADGQDLGRSMSTTIRSEWRAKLDFALKESLTELVDPAIQVTGVLEGDDMGAITATDVEALATIGLPSGSRWLYPSIRSRSFIVGAECRFLLASTDDGLDPFTGEPAPEGPEHLICALPRSGRVVLIHDGYSSRAYVNRSVVRFVEMAWRYHYVKPILFHMQYVDNDDGSPATSSAEQTAVKDALWRWAEQTDLFVDVEPTLSYWWGAIRAYT